MEKEQWKTITHDIRYEISNFGRVRNKKAGIFFHVSQQNHIDTHKCFWREILWGGYN